MATFYKVGTLRTGGELKRLSTVILFVLWTLMPAAFAGSLTEATIEMVPLGQVVGDGHTEVRVVVAVWDDDGGIEGLGGEISGVGQGSLLGDAGGGMYVGSWTPPVVERPTDAPMELTFQGSGAMTHKTVVVPLMPDHKHRMSVDLEPSSLVLDQKSGATLTIRLSDGGRASREQAELLVTTTVGVVGEVVHQGGGVYVAAFLPPNERFPQVAMITVVDQRNAEETFGVASLPLFGQVDFPVRGIPHAELMVDLDGESFGPVTADGEGKARLRLIVPPGVSQGTITSRLAEQEHTETLDLRTPSFPRVALLPLQESAPADGSASLTLRALVVNERGELAREAEVEFGATAGVVGDAQFERAGLFSSELTLPFASERGQITVQAALAGEMVGDAASLRFLPAPPGRVERWGQGIRLLTARGRALSGAPTIWSGGVTPLESGEDETYFTAWPASGELRAAPPLSPNSAYAVLVVPLEHRLQAKGNDQTALYVAVVDRFGYPIPGQPVSATVVAGDASLRQVAQATGPDGLARFELEGGAKTGVVTIQASSGLITGGAAVLQGLDGDLVPLAGSQWHRDRTEAWSQLIRRTTFDDGGMTLSAVPDFAVTPQVRSYTQALDRLVEPLTVEAGWVGGLYQFLQSPAGPELWQDEVRWGPRSSVWSSEDEDLMSAKAGGGFLTARGPIGESPMLGFEGWARLSFYRVALAYTNAGQSADEQVNDALWDVGAVLRPRLATSMGDGMLHAAGRLGLAYGDVAMFLDPTSDGAPVLNQLGLAGVVMGAEVGATVGSWSALVAGDLRVNSLPVDVYHRRLALQGAVGLSERWGVTLQLESLSRKKEVVALEDGDVDEHVAGETRDQLQSAQTGLRYTF